MSSKVIQHAEGLIQTVRVECTLPSGEISVGTGFPYVFLHRKIDDNRYWGIRTIVTNRHVIEHNQARANSGYFYLNKRDKKGRCLFGNKVMIQFKGGEWIHHPNDDIDLSVLNVGKYISELEKRDEKLYYDTKWNEIVSSNEIEWSRIGPLEDIVAVGYPNGL